MVSVIGDIHGCFYTLKTLVEQIREKYPGIEIYSVGDLIDRGNFSYEVIEFIISENIKFTPGNHDYMFYYFVKEPMSGMGRAWMYNGYESTLTSYDEHFEKISAHFEFLKKAPLFYNLSDCFISHAGISKYFKSKIIKDLNNDLNSLDELVANDLQNEHGILWTRDTLMNLGKLQVVGHTRKPEVTYMKKNNAVYIDTSAFSGNKLSSIIVENSEILDILSVPTFKEDIE